MEYKVKLNATIPLDSNKEADLIRYMYELKSRHKLGDMVANCVRFCWEHRDDVEKLGFKAEDAGLYELRKLFFKSVESNINELKKRVDTIYDLSFKTYMLAQMDKKLGLEEKSKNSLAAQFILERQVNDMCKALGIDDINHVWESNRQSNIEEKSKDVLEYIIECYDGIVSELKDNASMAVYAVPKVEDTKGSIKETVSDIKTGINKDNTIEYSKSNAVEQIQSEENNEPIDFDSNADIDMLEQFLGL